MFGHRSVGGRRYVPHHEPSGARRGRASQPGRCRRRRQLRQGRGLLPAGRRGARLVGRLAQRPGRERARPDRRVLLDYRVLHARRRAAAAVRGRPVQLPGRLQLQARRRADPGRHQRHPRAAAQGAGPGAGLLGEVPGVPAGRPAVAARGQRGATRPSASSSAWPRPGAPAGSRPPAASRCGCRPGWSSPAAAAAGWPAHWPGPGWTACASRTATRPTPCSCSRSCTRCTTPAAGRLPRLRRLRRREVHRPVRVRVRPALAPARPDAGGRHPAALQPQARPGADLPVRRAVPGRHPRLTGVPRRRPGHPHRGNQHPAAALAFIGGEGHGLVYVDPGEADRGPDYTSLAVRPGPAGQGRAAARSSRWRWPASGWRSPPPSCPGSATTSTLGCGTPPR